MSSTGLYAYIYNKKRKIVQGKKPSNLIARVDPLPPWLKDHLTEQQFSSRLLRAIKIEALRQDNCEEVALNAK